VLQIAVSAVLITGAVGAWQQIGHLRAQHTDVPSDRIVTAPISTAPFDSTAQADARLRSMRERIRQSPAVASVSFTRSIPSDYQRNFNTYTLPAADGASLRLRFTAVGASYFQTFDLDLLEGAPFRPSRSDEETGRAAGVIVNETAADQIRAITGGPVVGETIRSSGGSEPTTIRGVVEDVRVETAGEPIDPILHYYFGDSPSRYGQLAVRLKPGRTTAAMDHLRGAWAAAYSTYPFDPSFLDDAFDRLYETHRQVGLLAALAAGVAILIACLGLFSLSAFVVRRRTKEIGVRKALGATAQSIVGLLSKDILRLVGGGLLIAVPITYVGLDRFLQRFATRIDLGPALFLGASAMVLVLAGLAVSSQALRAAVLDPARALRDE
jgi:putative ABC transport system permease protein